MARGRLKRTRLGSRRKLRELDYTRGSLRSGSIDVVGTRRVVVAEKRGFGPRSCWWMGEQSRSEYEDGYLVMAHTTCATGAEIKRSIEGMYGPEALDPARKLGR